MKKKTDTQVRLCWECLFSRPNEDPRYKTPTGEPIFHNCYEDPTNIKRGLMDNTKACSKFK